MKGKSQQLSKGDVGLFHPEFYCQELNGYETCKCTRALCVFRPQLILVFVRCVDGQAWASGVRRGDS